jgi:hypothetical protein
LIGILLGCALLAIIYSILVVTSLKSKKYIVPAKNIEVTDEEILEIITTARKQFNDKSLKGANNTIIYCKDICFCLVADIARKFFPKSKRPFAELSVDEFLELFVYVSKRVNEIIDRPGLRLIKKIKLSTILSLGDAKKVIEDSQLMKMTKKYNLKKFFSTVMGALNVINPVYWIRRTVINTSLDFAVKKLCDVVIGIVGEETYKIYSKRVFEEPKEIDTNIDDIIKSLDEDLAHVSDEEIENYISSQGIEEKIKERKKRK